MNYYTSDLHFSYDKILALADRPFASVEEMNEKILENINSKVNPEDTLYILGDVSAGSEYVVPLLKRINCKLVLIIGNHDKQQLAYGSFRRCFESIHDSLMIKDGAYDLFLSHYPHAEWDGFYKGRFHFYGHVHTGDGGGSALMNFLPTAINVGVDVHDFMPKTAEELIKERLSSYEIPKMTLDVINSIIFPKVDDRAKKQLNFANLLSEESIEVAVYKDTIYPDFRGDGNMSYITIPEIVFKQYYEEHKKDYCPSTTYESFKENYICDEVEDLYEFAKELNAVLNVRDC